ncbi:MAG: hypothetical protein ACI9WU_000994, partial [Myxococcota bacterium]
MERLVDRWFTVDPRALAVLRVALGLLVIVDVVRRFAHVDLYYLPGGILLPPRPDHSYTWSILVGLESAAAAWAFLLGLLASAIWLITGWKTRLAQVVVLLGLIQLHNDYHPNSGGDVALTCLAFWTAFLPLGRCWSVDARRHGADFGSVRSPAVLAVLVQLVAIYLYTGLAKSGASWSSGEAVHYVLQLDQYLTGLGEWFRDVAPYALMEAATHGTIAVELVGAVLLLLPFGALWARRVTLAALGAMHIALLLLVNVGIFQPAMLLYYLVVWPREDMARLFDRLGSAVDPETPSQPGIRSRKLAIAAYSVLALAGAINVHEALVRNPGTGALVAGAGLPTAIPEPFRAVQRATAMSQLWSMFGPDVRKGEGRLLVVAQTADGQVLDLLTGQEPAPGPVTRLSGPSGPLIDTGWDDAWRKYSNGMVRRRTDDLANHLRAVLTRR